MNQCISIFVFDDHVKKLFYVSERFRVDNVPYFNSEKQPSCCFMFNNISVSDPVIPVRWKDPINQ